MQEYKIVKMILSDYVGADNVQYDEEENSFNTPICMVTEEDGVWFISFNLTLITEPKDIVLAANIINIFNQHQIMIEVAESYYLVFDENEICIELLWESDIYTRMEESEFTYEEARIVLTKEIIDNISAVENKENTTLN